MRKLLFALLLVAIGNVAFAAPLLFTTPAIDPRSSYLLGDPTTNQSYAQADTEFWPYFISLNGLALVPGQQVTLGVSGQIDYGGGTGLPAVLGLVFTVDNSVLGFQNLNRLNVADGGNLPIGVTTQTISPTTYYNTLSTDIAGDFRLDAGQTATVTIPTGAQWIAVGVWDSYFRDNKNPGEVGNVTVSVYAAESPVPEPGTYMMMFGGLTSLWLLGRKRK